MNKQDYEYRDLMAESWDLLRGDTSSWPDRFFFRDRIQTYGQPILDVGCGTGRLLLDYLADGLDIDGVDNSPEMLALCREKAKKLDLKTNLYQQEMHELDLPRKYQIIIVPSSSFQLVLDPKDAAAAMARFFDHLLPGGVLIMPFGIEDFIVNWKEGDSIERDTILLQQATDPETGLTYHRWSSDWFDPKNQLEHTTNRYDVLRDGEIIASETHVRSPATRWYTQQQALQLYKDAGFTNIQMYSGFKHIPAKPDDTLFAILGEKGKKGRKGSISGA
jgi:ubiquinone/menaquinone biosynthesis C-methylase UbiE